MPVQPESSFQRLAGVKIVHTQYSLLFELKYVHIPAYDDRSLFAMVCRSVVLEAVSDNVVHFLVFRTLDNTIVVAVVYSL